MDAKYNDLIDSWKWRVLLNSTAFLVWLGAVLALMSVRA